MSPDDAVQALQTLQAFVTRYEDPLVTSQTQNPYEVLVGCILSQRTREEVTTEATARLLSLAPSAQVLASLPQDTIASAIYPVGFWKTKAARLRECCRLLVERHGGQVPSDEAALLSLPGVGRKTAALVRAEGFGIPDICVDTHVHRIVNRWGLVRTKTPEETQARLKALLPVSTWGPLNRTLVLFGRHVCVPRRPRCDQCPVTTLCAFGSKRAIHGG